MDMAFLHSLVHIPKITPLGKRGIDTHAELSTKQEEELIRQDMPNFGPGVLMF